MIYQILSVVVTVSVTVTVSFPAAVTDGVGVVSGTGMMVKTPLSPLEVDDGGGGNRVLDFVTKTVVMLCCWTVV